MHELDEFTKNHEEGSHEDEGTTLIFLGNEGHDGQNTVTNEHEEHDNDGKHFFVDETVNEVDEVPDAQSDEK